MNPPKYIIEIPIRSQDLWITWGKLISQLGSAGQDPEDILRELLVIAANADNLGAWLKDLAGQAWVSNSMRYQLERRAEQIEWISKDKTG